MAKKRLDVALTELGLAESRQKAQALILAGEVYVDGQRVGRAGAPVGPEAKVEVRGRGARGVRGQSYPARKPHEGCLCLLTAVLLS